MLHFRSPARIVAGDDTLRSLARRGELMGMAAPGFYTADMVRTLPDDGNRYETIHGELLVTPAPRLWHQAVLVRLLAALSRYVEQHPVGVVLASPADLSWSDDTLVQPDLFVADTEQARSLDWKNVKALKLVVELLSPRTARFDRFTKRRLYQEAHIPLYWIVDLETEVVEIWVPKATFPETERERLIWRPSDHEPAFEMDLGELFKPI